LKVTYTEEAVADIVQAITYLNERNPTAAAKLDADIARCIERWPIGSSRVRSHDFVRVLPCGVGACRRFGFTTSAIPTSC
jgi:plasmid stabilization system protein ParE